MREKINKKELVPPVEKSRKKDYLRCNILQDKFQHLWCTICVKKGYQSLKEVLRVLHTIKQRLHGSAMTREERLENRDIAKETVIV